MDHRRKLAHIWFFLAILWMFMGVCRKCVNPENPFSIDFTDVVLNEADPATAEVSWILRIVNESGEEIGITEINDPQGSIQAFVEEETGQIYIFVWPAVPVYNPVDSDDLDGFYLPQFSWDLSATTEGARFNLGEGEPAKGVILYVALDDDDTPISEEVVAEALCGVISITQFDGIHLGAHIVGDMSDVVELNCVGYKCFHF